MSDSKNLLVERLWLCDSKAFNLSRFLVTPEYTLTKMLLLWLNQQKDVCGKCLFLLMLTFEGCITLQFPGEEEELLAIDFVKRRKVTQGEILGQDCSFLVPPGQEHGSYGSLPTASEMLKRQKMSSSSWIYRRGRAQGRRLSPPPDQRDSRMHVCRLARDRTTEENLSFVANLPETPCGQVRQSNTPGKPNNRMSPNIVRFTSRSSIILLH